ncbi:GtrA family protein [Fictibacillus nanhaiensis]|uniref:GtrA family protein n=1 Tax=Fictibacillus nanhaiensis TaxID=742169 RepID=UPI001C97996D|nr:GtrA family protein [Fictibacillus nanhaiensis]MBY6035819.1 GtrA family protein [Fictibacillus nanhaiensis]
MSHIISIFENYLKPTNSFVRFLLVGVVNTAIGLSVIFILMNGFLLSYWVSTFTGNLIGAAASFILNRNYTFKSNTSIFKGSLRFGAVVLICYFLSYRLSVQLVNVHLSSQDLLLISQNDVSVILGSILYTLSNYAGQRYFVFKK